MRISSVKLLLSSILAGCAAAFFLIGATPASQAVAEIEKIEYEVVDGAILVFGYRLETENPLPEIGDCEGCEAIGFQRSPDGRWILIESDVRLTANDIWLYDTSTGAEPKHVVDKRYGTHLLDTKWYSSRIFEVRWAGQGYGKSLLIDAENPGDGELLADLLLYNAERDIYARFDYELDTDVSMVEIGSAFSRAAGTERIPIPLDLGSRWDWASRIDKVEIDGAHLIVTYDAEARGKVTDRFPARMLGGTR